MDWNHRLFQPIRAFGDRANTAAALNETRATEAVRELLYRTLSTRRPCINLRGGRVMGRVGDVSVK